MARFWSVPGAGSILRLRSSSTHASWVLWASRSFTPSSNSVSASLPLLSALATAPAAERRIAGTSVRMGARRGIDQRLLVARSVRCIGWAALGLAEGAAEGSKALVAAGSAGATVGSAVTVDGGGEGDEEDEEDASACGPTTSVWA